VIKIFYSIVVKLIALDDGRYDFYPGQKLHSLFLNFVRQADQETAKHLHDEDREKSFTVSSFLGKAIEGPIQIEKSSSYFIRLTTLDDHTFDVLFSGLIMKMTQRENIRIGNIEYKVVEAFFDGEQSNWAGRASEEELLNKQYTSNLIKLRFHTPTVFRTGDQHCRYPIPQKIFTGLLGKFNKYSRYKIDEQIESKFKEITITEKKTQSRRIVLRDFYLEGFIGDVTFKVPEQDKQLIRVANTLADFAFYAGVGYKTTMGLGQVQRIPVE